MVTATRRTMARRTQTPEQTAPGERRARWLESAKDYTSRQGKTYLVYSDVMGRFGSAPTKKGALEIAHVAIDAGVVQHVAVFHGGKLVWEWVRPEG